MQRVVEKILIGISLSVSCTTYPVHIGICGSCQNVPLISKVIPCNILGLIFNLDSQMTSLQSSISSAQINENSYEKASTYEIKKSLALYQLKFLATNSQLKQHKTALNAGKKALSTLRDILMENEVYIKRLMK